MPLCTPNPPANGDIAACTGTTTNRGPGANTGYGNAALTGVTISVVPTAVVTGTSVGVRFDTGTVTNDGTIRSTAGTGISAVNATVNNSGIVFGAGITGSILPPRP